MRLKRRLFLLCLVCFTLGCSREKVLEKSKPAFVFKGGSVKLDSFPSEFSPFVNRIAELDFIKSPGYVIVPDGEQMYEIVGQMAVIGYEPIFLVDNFGFAEKLTKRFAKTTFFADYKFSENTIEAKLNWVKAKYLAGAIACLITDKHRFAYLGSDTVSSSAFAQINSFALGAKSLDPQAEVDWIKLKMDKETPLAEQLKILQKSDYGLVILGENDQELEQAIEKLKLPFVGFGTDKNKQRLARFYYDYSPLWIRALQDFVLDSLEDSYEYGLEDYCVGLVDYGENLPKEKIFLLDSVLVRVDSSAVFVGPIFDCDDNMRVYYGDTILDTELRFMNWVVKGVRE